MRIRKVILPLIMALITALVFSSCGESVPKYLTPTVYELPEQLRTIRSDVVAENDRIELSWDLDRTCVIVRDKQTGQHWSTIPYEFYQSGAEADGYQADGLNSSLYITYIDEKNNEIELRSNAGADYILARKIENGVRLTYYFDSIGISVPLDYTINADGISVSIVTADVSEGEQYRLVSASVSPFFASVKNNTGSYLFVPSGSGALMMTDDSVRQPRSYSEPVYGIDGSEQPTVMATNQESIRVPVFGASGRSGGILGVIESGAENANIHATAGDEQYGYSTAYAEFRIRGGAEAYLSGQDNLVERIVKYADGYTDVERMSVRYIILPAGKCSYNDMAAAYRDYLAENEGLKQGVETPDAVFNFYGAFTERKLMAGIPYYSLSSLTTFDQAQTILDDIKGRTNAKMAANLKGFGSDGIDYGKFGGGFKAAGLLGGNKALRNFSDWCKNNSIDSFMDFELVYYNKSSLGFTPGNSATIANGLKAQHYYYDTVIREQKASGVNLAGRKMLSDNATKIADKIASLGISGAAMNSLSSVKYSDYSTAYSNCGANMGADVKAVLSAVTDKNLKTLGSAANAYAAVNLDYVVNTPSGSSRYYALDQDVPFYQMVFKGSTGITGATINLSENAEKEYLRSVSTGCALNFSLCNNFNQSIVTGRHSAVAMSVYSDLADDIERMITDAQPLLSKVRTATITSYEINNDLSKTVFSNGVTVYANFGTAAVKTDLGTVQPLGFIFQ